MVRLGSGSGWTLICSIGGEREKREEKMGTFVSDQPTTGIDEVGCSFWIAELIR